MSKNCMTNNIVDFSVLNIYICFFLQLSHRKQLVKSRSNSSFFKLESSLESNKVYYLCKIVIPSF